MEYFKKDMDCSVFVDGLDDDKVMEFIKKQLIVNWDCQEGFIEEFRFEILKSEKLEVEDKLFLILRYPKCDELLTDFVKNDLTGLYDEEKYTETFYLITSMFHAIIVDISHYPDSGLLPCYRMVEEMIIKLAEVEPGLVKDFIDECREEGYGIYYPEFRKLISKLKW